MSMPELTAKHRALRTHALNSLESFTVRLRNFKEALESEEGQKAYTTGTVLSEQEYSEEVLNRLEELWLRLDEFRDEFMETLDLET